MAGGAPLKRGEIWWARLPSPDKTRPVLLVSRPEAFERRDFVMVAPISARIRDIPAEVLIGATEGAPRASAANCDSLSTISKRLLLRRIGALQGSRLDELDQALKFALGLD